MHWRRYWDIILYRAYAELKSEVELNYMGYVWWIAEPLLNTILFYVIVAAVLERSGPGTVTFVLVGAVTWQWISSSVLVSVGSIFEAGAMLKQIYLPKIVLPLISILASSWKFGFVFLFLLIWVWATGHPPARVYVALPLVLLLELGVILAVSLPLAVIIPYFPDARITIDAVLRSLMLLSGIFFPVERLPAAAHFYFYLNPMAVLIEAYRMILIQHVWPAWERLGYVAAFCAVLFAVAGFLYTWLDRSLVKAIHR